jgi:hypothetical protein
VINKKAPFASSGLFYLFIYSYLWEHQTQKPFPMKVSVFAYRAEKANLEAAKANAQLAVFNYYREAGFTVEGAERKAEYPEAQVEGAIWSAEEVAAVNPLIEAVLAADRAIYDYEQSVKLF